MYKHADIHYEPQHPMLKSINLSQTEEFEEEENLGFQEVSSGYFGASAACKIVQKPGFMGMGASKSDKRKYENSVRCQALEQPIEDAYNRIPKATKKLLKGLNGSEVRKLKEEIRTAAGGYEDKNSTKDVIKALKGPLKFKFANGKKKDIASGKLVNNIIEIDIP